MFSKLYSNIYLHFSISSRSCPSFGISRLFGGSHLASLIAKFAKTNFKFQFPMPRLRIVPIFTSWFRYPFVKINKWTQIKVETIWWVQHEAANKPVKNEVVGMYIYKINLMLIVTSRYIHNTWFICYSRSVTSCNQSLMWTCCKI